MIERSKQAMRFVLSGGTPKAFAIDHHLHPAQVIKALQAVGVRKHYLSQDEIALVERVRSGRGDK